MDDVEYMKAASLTASDKFHKDLIPPAQLKGALHFCIQHLEDLDAMKKALFYGKPYTDKIGLTLYTKEGYGCIPPNLIHGILGVATEAAELLDALRIAMFHGLPIDQVNLKEELGDIEWYLAMLYSELGTTSSEVRALNIAKLKQRYPDKFTSEKAIHRDLQAERATLEQG